jgi:hypothetical protein
VTANAVAPASFTNIPGSYDVYAITGTDVRPSNTNYIRARVSTDNGTTYLSLTTDYTINGGGLAVGYIPISGESVLAERFLSTTGGSFITYAFNLGSAGANNYKGFLTTAMGLSRSTLVPSSWSNTPLPVNAIEFFAPAPDTISGTFRLYGIVNS